MYWLDDVKPVEFEGGWKRLKRNELLQWKGALVVGKRERHWRRKERIRTQSEDASARWSIWQETIKLRMEARSIHRQQIRDNSALRRAHLHIKQLQEVSFVLIISFSYQFIV